MKYFFTFRYTKTGKVYYATATSFQHACAQYNMWCGNCLLLKQEELPVPPTKTLPNPQSRVISEQPQLIK